MEQTTWPTLWGCQSYDFDKIQDTLVDNNIECMENRLSINLGLGSASFLVNLPYRTVRFESFHRIFIVFSYEPNQEQIGQKGILDITKPTHNTNAIFAAQWIHFAMRLNPDIPKYLQVLIGWLEKGNSLMDEEIFLHVAIFFLVKEGYIPSLESIVEKHRELPPPELYADQIRPIQRKFTRFSKIFACKLFLVEVVASDFFQFIKGFNVEEGYMNTYTGDIGLKIESEDIIDNSGLTVLHPYYSNITLLPFK